MIREAGRRVAAMGYHLLTVARGVAGTKEVDNLNSLVVASLKS